MNAARQIAVDLFELKHNFGMSRIVIKYFNNKFNDAFKLKSLKQ